jgi:RNA polymerase sigma-70 factor (ECF subfamily)
MKGLSAGVHERDATLVARLRQGDERAFDEAVSDFYPPMFAVARGYVRERGLAEEVVQEAWIGILRGLDGFEGRASFRTWVLRIVANIARDHAMREARSQPFSALERDDDALVDPERFQRSDQPYPGGWRGFPMDWRTLPESWLLARETLELVDGAMNELPERQRLVMILRDVVGCSAPEVCETLGITLGNQRVLLHRARVRVRARLERYFDA